MKIKNIFTIVFLFCGSLAFAQKQDVILYEFRIPATTTDTTLTYNVPNEIDKYLDYQPISEDTSAIIVTVSKSKKLITFKIKNVQTWREQLKAQGLKQDSCRVGVRKNGVWTYYGEILFTPDENSNTSLYNGNNEELQTKLNNPEKRNLYNGNNEELQTKLNNLENERNYLLYGYGVLSFLLILIILITCFRKKKAPSKKSKQPQNIDFNEVLQAIHEGQTAIRTAIGDSQTSILSEITRSKAEMLKNVTERNDGNGFPSRGDEEQGGYPSPSLPSSPPLIVKYVSYFDDSNGVMDRDIKEDGFGRLFKIEIAGQEAVYSINNDKKAKRIALENFQTIKPLVEISPDSTYSIDPQDIITVNKGKLRHDQDQGKWFIDKFVVIKFI
jgi:hypothetical protein